MTNHKLPKKKEIVNRIKGYIKRIEDEKTPREKLDTLYILKRLLKPSVFLEKKGKDERIQ